jgi:leucyl-tRNA synthetase
MTNYNPQKIEPKWQKKWEKLGLSKAKDFDKKKKQYILIEFPYPSGDGLHVGHVRSYSALDALARKKRMEGYNVLYPIGYDAFGLPTENYAIKTGIHPIEVTKKNTKIFEKQLKSLGLSFDWSREINTTDPKYYKWTQWIFLKMFEKDLAYQAEMPINWCPKCKIGLANEEVVGGKCERCGTAVERKKQKQWMLKITAYADRLLKDLEKVDYSERIKTQQINWIGRSEGTGIKFQISNFKFQISVFTTRIDTIFGVTALVLAPEHEIISKFKSQISNLEEVENYIGKSKKKSELERTDLEKEKTGVPLKGICAVNPLNNEKIPIWVGDYVISTYGGGAVMVVPAHDKRDFEFAKKYNLPIKYVVKPGVNFFLERTNKDLVMERIVTYKNYEIGLLEENGGVFVFTKDENLSDALKRLLGRTSCNFDPARSLHMFSKKKAYTGPGFLVDSGNFDGLFSETAIAKITEWLEKNNLGKKAINYKLRDWVFSRQHYWGEPIPIIHCEKCGIVPVPEKDLPVKLPYVKKYKPTNSGESPLAAIKEWVSVKCPECKGPAKRETDTMPNWAGSNWYYLAYLMRGISNFQFPIFKYKKAFKYWMPVDLYNGGMEHTTLHLLYSRFIYKFLYDIGAVPTIEPYAKRRSHGMVLASDGRKMSKSFGNVINPDEVVKKYGADSLRLYEMFMGPFEQAINWSTEGLEGCYRFLKKIWALFENNAKFSKETSKDLVQKLNYSIKKIGDDLEEMKFNTAVSSMMEFINAWGEEGQSLSKKDAENFLKILASFAPHICEEIWAKLKHKTSIFKEKWPKYDEKLIKKQTFELVIQINGKVRDKVEVSADISEEEAKKIVLEREKIKNWLKNQPPQKVIFVKGKLVNIVL